VTALEFRNADWSPKNQNVRVIRSLKNFYDRPKLRRFDTIPDRDRQTDRRTPYDSNARASCG